MASVRVTCPKCGSLVGVYGNTNTLTQCSSCKTKYQVIIRNNNLQELRER